ncbi:hypothetical protein MVEN_02234100 [Mycena venus]|uniref:Uncharacterized protein n=1 Tax=Mycena venus TaxID=2733690 RepID=A0A8H6X804_9AGAR|nr:hypothetical protein MVEN_02234100 [Mycena venus]
MALDQAQLIGTFLELVLQGFYIMLFIEHVKILHGSAANSWAFRYLLATSITIFLLATTHTIVDVTRATIAFTATPSIPNAAAKYYANFSAFMSIFRTAIYDALTIVSDAFIVYRCFLVWGKNYWITLLPFLLFLADFATSVWSTSALGVAPTGDPFAVIAVTLRVRYFYGFTIAVNLLCTALISYKIWNVNRGAAGRFGGPVVSKLVAVFIESAAIYSMFLVALLTTSILGTDVMFILLNMMCPIIGIVFSSVIVRVTSERSKASFQASSLRSRETRFGSRAEPTGAMEIRLETVTHTGTDGPDKYTNAV